jgi:endonuclease I
VKSYRFSGAFTAASGVDGYIVLRKLGSAITDAPEDGVIYQRGDAIGATKVVYSNSATSFVPNNIIAGSNYYFAVFAYNGVGAARNYLQTAPLAGNVATPATMMTGSEYATISTASATFKSDLHALIYPHTAQFYSSYGAFMVPLFEARDTTGDQRVITCVYSGENKMYVEPFDWTATGYSREHTYCHNWMPSNPADAPERPEYADYHHLFPTNQDDANVLRSNYPLGVVVGTPTSTYLGCKFGNDVNGNKVFEPRNEQKGDAARAIMYIAVCYDGVDGFNWKFRNPISSSINYGQDQNVLKAWHFQDPPSNREIARNDYIDSIQGNRNPFIDSIQYACFIDFTTMGKIESGCSAVSGLEEVLDNSLAIYPVPSRDVVFIKIEGTTISSYEVMDMQSRTLQTENEINSSFVTMNASGLKAGTYLVKVSTPKGNVIRKMVIE